MKKKKNFKNIILIVSILLFIVITITILTNKILYIDTRTHEYLINLRNNRLNNTMIFITNICNTITLIILTIILLFTMKNKKDAKYILYNLIGIGIVSQILKFIFRRPRPIEINLITESGFSYPSGHSMAVIAYFGFLTYLIYKNRNKKIDKYLLILIFIILSLLICISRIYLGVHYLSDVLGGIFIAIIYLIIFISIYNKKEE